MKKNNFRIDKLKKLLSDKNKYWIKKYLLELCNKEKELEDFLRFECSSFFVGEQNSKINLSIYCKHRSIINRRFKNIDSVCKRLYNIKYTELLNYNDKINW